MNLPDRLTELFEFVFLKACLSEPIYLIGNGMKQHHVMSTEQYIM